MEDALANGATLRILTVMDECTCEGLAIDVALTTSADRVLGVLAALMAQHGAPAYLRSDNGAEFVATAVQAWLGQCGVQTLSIEPGKPWQNGIEIGRFYPSSRLCGACGAINNALTLADRAWTCACGATHDRNLNAARTF